MPAALAQSMPSQSDALEGIGRAFFASLDRDGRPVFSVFGAFVALVILAALVRWAVREARRERVAQKEFKAHHDAAMSKGAAISDERAWVRVPAHVHMALLHLDRDHHRYFYESCETQDLSGGAVSFLSEKPPALGTLLHFTLDLKEKSPLSLRGVVARIEPPTVPGAPSRVAVKLGPITPGEREHLARWVAMEETREIEASRRGRVCSRCGRPIADEVGDTHSTCAAQAADQPHRDGRSRLPPVRVEGRR